MSSLDLALISLFAIGSELLGAALGSVSSLYPVVESHSVAAD